MKDYKNVWDDLSSSFSGAATAVAGIEDEEEIRRNGAITALFLRDILQVTPESKVLEIGCGIARIGRELAPLCAEWHGTDISGKMIQYAAGRTAGIDNIHLHELPDSNLGIFPDDYFDCVYSSIVFMHLDKVDMFGYMQEAFRVLAPGGKAYFDTYNILAPDAWQDFLQLQATFPPGHRLAHMSQFSTPQEMEKLMLEAGFESVTIDGTDGRLVAATGSKPAHSEVAGAPRTTGSGHEATSTALSGNAADTRSSLSASLITAEAVNLVAANKALRSEVDGLAKHILIHKEQLSTLANNASTQTEYVHRLESALREKNRYLEVLEERLRVYEQATLRTTRKARTALAAGAAGLALGLGFAVRSTTAKRNNDRP